MNIKRTYIETEDERVERALVDKKIAELYCGPTGDIIGTEETKKNLSLTDKALRYNNGKIRYDLLEPYAIQELARVFTKGAEKYEDHNWEKGMNWSSMLASCKRHIAAWEMGTNIDTESGLSHLAHAAWNIMGLISYSKIYPQGDDRQCFRRKTPKIGLDVDEVLCDWVGGWCMKFGGERPSSWNFDRKIKERFMKMEENHELEYFMLGLERKIDPNEIPFEPHCYVTSRCVPTELTERWLDRNGFPTRPVYTVGMGSSKVDILKEAGVDIFVDDSFKNYEELNNAGICTFLLDAKHNRRYNVGSRRLYHLKDLVSPN
jgi:hypothetical protein